MPFRLRIFFRGAFLLLALATVALALSVLREEKELSYRSYREVFYKTAQQIMARLQHPAGQLALLNPTLSGAAQTPLRPLLLPFSAIDFDDKAKAEQAAEMAGCLVQYPNHAQLCVAIGNNPAAGGFIYAVGAFVTGPLVAHAPGDRDLGHAHRLLVDVAMRGRTYHWVGPLEADAASHGKGVRGRLTGFTEDDDGQLSARPDRDFRGWLWQDGRCIAASAAAPPSQCLQRSFFSVRLPVEMFREELYNNPQVVWPPPDLSQIQVRVRAKAPGNDPPLFDSNSSDASAPFALADLRGQLLAGETLRIRRLHRDGSSEIASLTGQPESTARPSRLLRELIEWLKVEGYDQPLEAREVVATPAGDYEVRLDGDVRSADRSLALVAGRLNGFVAAMLAAILLTWIAIELRIIRRITLLTKRAASVKRSAQAPEVLRLNLESLRGRDELGLLASVLADLLQRVQEDARRERLRAEQEREQWHAVGHEIMAPLQSLTALHTAPEDPSLRYLERMRQAIRVLYGSASPSESFRSAALAVRTLDLQAFLSTLADNAAHAGIERVELVGSAHPVIVRAEEYALEDVITHVLANADRYRPVGTPIRMTLRSAATTAEVRIHNVGPPIEPALLERIFEYGVSDSSESGDAGRRGQGLFVARAYMAKMGGTIVAVNVDDGVEFVLMLGLA